MERAQFLPSSMLFVGKPGTGLPNLCMELAGMLLCEEANDGRPCSVCNSCHIFAHGVHPDLHVISTEEAEEICDSRFRDHSKRYTNLDYAKKVRKTSLRSIITVDQIRAVTDALNNSAGIGSTKICLIYPAETLNLNAANALLKSLEEPTGRTYYLLLSSFPGNLPATIRSRCSRINLDNPTNDESIEWLVTMHNVDSNFAQLLTQVGFGPYEVLQMNTKETVECHQTVINGLTGLISGSVSTRTFTHQSGSYDIRFTLKVIQSEIYRGLRESVLPYRETKQPVLISPELALEFRDVLFSIYLSIGRFLNWPKKSVDEQLFLEYISQELNLSHYPGQN